MGLARLSAREGHGARGRSRSPYGGDNQGRPLLRLRAAPAPKEVELHARPAELRRGDGRQARSGSRGRQGGTRAPRHEAPLGLRQRSPGRREGARLVPGSPRGSSGQQRSFASPRRQALATRQTAAPNASDNGFCEARQYDGGRPPHGKGGLRNGGFRAPAAPAAQGRTSPQRSSPALQPDGVAGCAAGGRHESGRDDTHHSNEGGFTDSLGDAAQDANRDGVRDSRRDSPRENARHRPADPGSACGMNDRNEDTKGGPYSNDLRDTGQGDQRDGQRARIGHGGRYDAHGFSTGAPFGNNIPNDVSALGVKDSGHYDRGYRDRQRHRDPHRNLRAIPEDSTQECMLEVAPNHRETGRESHWDSNLAGRPERPHGRRASRFVARSRFTRRYAERSRLHQMEAQRGGNDRRHRPGGLGGMRGRSKVLSIAPKWRRKPGVRRQEQDGNRNSHRDEHAGGGFQPAVNSSMEANQTEMDTAEERRDSPQPGLLPGAAPKAMAGRSQQGPKGASSLSWQTNNRRERSGRHRPSHRRAHGTQSQDEQASASGGAAPASAENSNQAPVGASTGELMSDAPEVVDLVDEAPDDAAYDEQHGADADAVMVPDAPEQQTPAPGTVAPGMDQVTAPVDDRTLDAASQCLQSFGLQEGNSGNDSRHPPGGIVYDAQYAETEQVAEPGNMDDDNEVDEEDDRPLNPEVAARIGELIRGVYIRRNPSKLAEVDSLLLKYEGQEVQMYEAICAKYGEQPEDIDGLIGGYLSKGRRDTGESGAHWRSNRHRQDDMRGGPRGFAKKASAPPPPSKSHRGMCSSRMRYDDQDRPVNPGAHVGYTKDGGWPFVGEEFSENSASSEYSSSSGDSASDEEDTAWRPPGQMGLDSRRHGANVREPCGGGNNNCYKEERVTTSDGSALRDHAASQDNRDLMQRYSAIFGTDSGLRTDTFGRDASHPSRSRERRTDRDAGARHRDHQRNRHGTGPPGDVPAGPPGDWGEPPMRHPRSMPLQGAMHRAGMAPPDLVPRHGPPPPRYPVPRHNFPPGVPPGCPRPFGHAPRRPPPNHGWQSNRGPPAFGAVPPPRGGLPPRGEAKPCWDGPGIGDAWNQ